MLRLLGDFFSQTPTGAVLLDPRSPRPPGPPSRISGPLCPPPTLAVWSRHSSTKVKLYSYIGIGN